MADKLIIRLPLPRIKRAAQQQGMMLIVLVFFAAIAATAYMINALSKTSIQTERDIKTAEALAQAKAALIGYAVTYDDNHSGEVFGYLPCPDTSATDTNGEGSQSPCGSQDVSMLGRLPWKTLKISPLKDGYGECLWYAVSGTYKNNPKTDNLTPNTSGLLEVMAADGSSYLADPADPAVAVVYAPGPRLADQDGTVDSNAVNCGGNYSASNYLDTDVVTGTNNAGVSASENGISTFIAALDSQRTPSNEDHFNDKLLIIKRGDIFASYCKKYANTLLSNVSASTNNCNDGSGSPKEVCSAASNNLQEYCAPQSCKDAAQAFVQASCLSNLADAACQTAITELKACHA